MDHMAVLAKRIQGRYRVAYRRRFPLDFPTSQPQLRTEAGTIVKVAGKVSQGIVASRPILPERPVCTITSWGRIEMGFKKPRKPVVLLYESQELMEVLKWLQASRGCLTIPSRTFNIVPCFTAYEFLGPKRYP